MKYLAALLLGLTAWMLWRYVRQASTPVTYQSAKYGQVEDVDWLVEFREPEWVRVA